MERCSHCHDVGWILDGETRSKPNTVELLECPLPDCETSRREIAVPSVFGRFREVVSHQSDGIVMALPGFTG